MVLCLPEAIAKLAASHVERLGGLAEKAGMPVREALRNFGRPVVAAILMTGSEPPACHLLHAR